MTPLDPNPEQRPVDNAPYRSLQHAGLTIEGYSRAAVQTYWRVPELKLGFDLGGQPWGFMGTPTWFVSHAHLDHIAQLPVYVARRRMMRMEPPTIYVPAPVLEDVRRLLLVFQRLDRACRRRCWKMSGDCCSSSNGSIAAEWSAICAAWSQATKWRCRAIMSSRLLR
jgi:ribonuclease BN (tRNA processing enzyme)